MAITPHQEFKEGLPTTHWVYGGLHHSRSGPEHGRVELPFPTSKTGIHAHHYRSTQLGNRDQCTEVVLP